MISAGTILGRQVSQVSDGFPDDGETLPQLGTNIRINGGHGEVDSCVMRGTSVWCAQTVVVRFNTETRVVIQFYRINWPVGGVPSLSSTDRIDDVTGNNYYAFPSIAVNKNNDVMLGYNRFNRTEYAGAFFAYRRASDPPGGYFFDVPIKAGEDPYEKVVNDGRNRWGDYSTTVVDPLDDTSFWTLQEFAGTKSDAGTSLWGTYWTKVSLRTGICTVRLDRSATDVPGTASSFRATVTSSFPDCSYLTSPNASWIRSQLISSSGTTSIYEFQVSANRRNTARAATISFASETFQVRQAANPNPPPAEPVLSVVKFDAPTSARVGDSVPLSAMVRNTGTRGAGRFRIGFYLSQKLPVTNRDTFAGVGCPVNQGLITDAVTTCNVSFQLDTSLAPGQYFLAAIADDREEVTMFDRSPSIRVADSGTLVVQPAANAPAITATGVVHAATAVAGAVSPGQILVIYGSRLGPANLTTLALDAQGRVTSVLAGARVFFDGVPSPMVYASAGQLSVIVPYSVSGKTSTQVVVDVNGIKSNASTLAVVASAPGLFSVDFSGKNQVAALNEDGSVNSAANPVEAGKLIVLYGTGAGTFRSNPVDGAVIGVPLPEFLTPLTLEIGGSPAEILYAGPAPGLVSGVFQINARVPASTPAGAQVPIRVLSATTASPVGTTIAVK
ncbi:MAG: hypothetical protein FJ411_04395 [Verrucomicrobia bacterium]|nr:hypothetical protein [Verrucomicrobiota bacterium]